MSPEQALSILDQVCAQTTATRNDHQTLVTAIETLDKYIKQNSAPESIKDIEDGNNS